MTQLTKLTKLTRAYEPRPVESLLWWFVLAALIIFGRCAL